MDLSELAIWGFTKLLLHRSTIEVVCISCQRMYFAHW
jgi:hypothetical protein